MLVVEDWDDDLCVGVASAVLLFMIFLAFLMSCACVLRTAEILEFRFFC